MAATAQIVIDQINAVLVNETGGDGHLACTLAAAGMCGRAASGSARLCACVCVRLRAGVFGCACVCVFVCMFAYVRMCVQCIYLGTVATDIWS